MKRTTTGRCHKCNIRFVWHVNLRLYHALCPICDTPLKQTTHLFKGKTLERVPHARIG